MAEQMARRVSIYTDAQTNKVRGQSLSAYIGSTRYAVVGVRGLGDIARLEVVEWPDGSVHVHLSELIPTGSLGEKPPKRLRWRNQRGHNGERVRFLSVRAS